MKNEIGEIYYEGNCTTNGYYNQPALTAMNFIPNPFKKTIFGNLRLYKTGEKEGALVAITTDGLMPRVGRIITIMNEFMVVAPYNDDEMSKRGIDPLLFETVIPVDEIKVIFNLDDLPELPPEPQTNIE